MPAHVVNTLFDCFASLPFCPMQLQRSTDKTAAPDLDFSFNFRPNADSLFWEIPMPMLNAHSRSTSLYQVNGSHTSSPQFAIGRKWWPWASQDCSSCNPRHTVQLSQSCDLYKALGPKSNTNNSSTNMASAPSSTIVSYSEASGQAADAMTFISQNLALVKTSIDPQQQLSAL